MTYPNKHFDREMIDTVERLRAYMNSSSRIVFSIDVAILNLRECNRGDSVFKKEQPLVLEGFRYLDSKGEGTLKHIEFKDDRGITQKNWVFYYTPQKL